MPRKYIRKFTHRLPTGAKCLAIGSIYMEEELGDRLNLAARRLHISKSEVYRRGLRMYLKHVEDNHYENDKTGGNSPR